MSSKFGVRQITFFDSHLIKKNNQHQNCSAAKRQYGVNCSFQKNTRQLQKNTEAFLKQFLPLKKLIQCVENDGNLVHRNKNFKIWFKKLNISQKMLKR
jgi:hypothetical protein